MTVNSEQKGCERKWRGNTPVCRIGIDPVKGKILILAGFEPRSSNTQLADVKTEQIINIIIIIIISSVAFVCQRTILTERPPLAREVSANFRG
jgi:hypothetical protein